MTLNLRFVMVYKSLGLGGTCCVDISVPGGDLMRCHGATGSDFKFKLDRSRLLVPLAALDMAPSWARSDVPPGAQVTRGPHV